MVINWNYKNMCMYVFFTRKKLPVNTKLPICNDSLILLILLPSRVTIFLYLRIFSQQEAFR